jgi:hypothetical protein
VLSIDDGLAGRESIAEPLRMARVSDIGRVACWRSESNVGCATIRRHELDRVSADKKGTRCEHENSTRERAARRKMNPKNTGRLGERLKAARRIRAASIDLRK